MTGLDHFREKYGLRNQAVLLFPYGSQVYGTASDKSDYDYLAVALGRANTNIHTGEEYRNGDTNIHLFTRNDWQHQLNDHKIHALESYFLPDHRLPDEDLACRKHFNFKLDLRKLRNELSEKASHSFVKAKKKIEKEKDYYIGWKSLFHSLRILNFGHQIASQGKISDYGAANQYWFDILKNPQYEWGYFEEKYKPIFNQLSTEFRKVAPK